MQPHTNICLFNFIDHNSVPTQYRRENSPLHKSMLIFIHKVSEWFGTILCFATAAPLIATSLSLLDAAAVVVIKWLHFCFIKVLN